MKQIAKKLLAVLLIVCCLCTSDLGAFFSSAAEGRLFFDDFSNTSLSGWADISAGKVEAGAYKFTGDGSNLVSSPVTVSKYAVQSKVLLKKASGATNSTVSIVVGSNATMTEYYEFGVGVVGKTSYAFIYKRCSDDERSKTIYQLTSDIPGTTNGRISQNTEYDLTAIVEEGKISCYINGVSFKKYHNVGTIGQYAGVRSVGANAEFDDYLIKEEGEKKVEKIELLNTPEKVTITGVGLNFDVKVIYSGLHGCEIISSDTEGVRISGFDGELGQKNFTVSYEGATTSFKANVVKDVEPLLYFQDDFEDGIDTEEWTEKELTTNDGYGFNYLVEGSGGQAVVTFPSNIGDYTNVITAQARVKNAIFDDYDMKNYAVEMDANIVKNSTVEGARAADAAMDLANAGGYLYSYRVRGDGTAILYYHTTIVAQTTISNFKLGQEFHMKGLVYDGMIYCYYNDQCVLVYQNANLRANKRGLYIGFRGVNGTVKFDNFIVGEIFEKSIWAATSISIDDVQTGQSNLNTIKAYEIDMERYIVKLHYGDGSFAPYTLTESMLSGYKSDNRNDQQVVLQYGSASKKLYYDYTQYILFEDFNGGETYSWTDATTSYLGCMTTEFKDGLQIKCNRDTETREMSRYVNLFENYPNVKISGDFALQPTSNAKTRSLGIRARYSGSVCYEYLLRYEPLQDEFYAYLYRRNKGLEELKVYSGAQLADMIGAEELQLGVSYTLTLECIDNQLFLYFNGKLLDIYYDETEKVILSGEGAGYRVVNTSATIKNFRVEEAFPRKVKSISVSEVEGDITLYQGFEISPYDYTLNVLFDDGMVFNRQMTADNIGEYDNITPGTKEVLINCLNQKQYLKVQVVERPEYIKEFADLIKKCRAADKVTLDDKETIDNLKETYNSLSGYEIGTIDEKLIEKYHKLVDAMYRLEHPELDEYDTLYVNDFNEPITEDDWSTYSTGTIGTWRTLNSMLVNEQDRYGLSGISYVEYVPFYGEINAVEADIMLANEPGVYVSMLSNICDLGYYHVRITNAEENEEGEPAIMVQLYKYVSSHRKLAEVDTALKGLEIKTGEWHKLRFTNIDGVLTVYLDDVKVLDYNDGASSDRLTKGTFGFRSLYGDMRHDSLRVMGTALEGEEYVPQIEPTYYKDDFEDETVGKNPSHWMEETDSDNWKVYKKNNSLVYGTASKEYGYTWLHTFESNPTVIMDFMTEHTGKTGRIEFLTRYTQETYSYAGIGYDFAKAKWYIYTNRGEDFGPRTIYADDTYKLEAGKWNTIKIVEDGECIQVYVNDKLVVEDKQADMAGFGRIGMLSEGANLYIDNLSYTMPHGGKVTDGVTEYLFDLDTFGSISHMEIESLGGNNLFGVSSSYQYTSNDNGLTWVQNKEDYTEVVGKGMAYPSVLQLSKNEYIMVYADTFTVHKSTDGMKTWTQIGQVIPDIGDNKNDFAQLEALIHVNSLFKFTLSDGTERIFLPVGMRRTTEDGKTNGHYTRVFYSDDGGKTWTESENDTRDITPNYTDDADIYYSWTEAKMIMGSDGVLRMYNSRQYDCIVYT